MSQYKITISKNTSRTALAKWLYSLRVIENKSIPLALSIADDIFAGHDFTAFLFGEEKIAGDAICTLTEIIEVNPYAEHFREQSEYYALRDRGAAGDVEAAIAYCKLEVQGLVSHGAMG